MREQDLLGEHQDAVIAEQRLRTTAVIDETTAIAFLGRTRAARGSRSPKTTATA
jgi:hypothetical protein